MVACFFKASRRLPIFKEGQRLQGNILRTNLIKSGPLKILSFLRVKLIGALIASAKCLMLFFLRFYFYLFDGGGGAGRRENEQAGGEAEGQGEAGSLLIREPDMGLNPMTLRS